MIRFVSMGIRGLRPNPRIRNCGPIPAITFAFDKLDLYWACQHRNRIKSQSGGAGSREGKPVFTARFKVHLNDDRPEGFISTSRRKSNLNGCLAVDTQLHHARRLAGAGLSHGSHRSFCRGHRTKVGHIRRPPSSVWLGRLLRLSTPDMRTTSLSDGLQLPYMAAESRGKIERHGFVKEFRGLDLGWRLAIHRDIQVFDTL